MVFVSSVAAAAVDKINFVVWKLLAVVWAEERWRHSCLRATPAPAPTCTRSSTQRPLEEILLAASSSISVHPSFSSPSRNRKNKYDDPTPKGQSYLKPATDANWWFSHFLAQNSRIFKR